MSNTQAIRGTRIGAGPMGEIDHGIRAERRAVSYWDENGVETVRYFAADVPDEEIPEFITAPQSGLPAGRDKDNPPRSEKIEPFKSHLDYVKERRTPEEAVQILEDALKRRRQMMTVPTE